MKTVLTQVLVELDCLLDTRMGVVSYMDSSLAEELAAHPDYFSRLDDKFDKILPYFPQAEWEANYAKRTTEMIMGHSYMTGIVQRLKSYQDAIATYGGDMPVQQKLAVTVNLYPYAFSDSDKAELKDTLHDVLGIPDIRLVSLMPELVVPSMIKSTYSEFILYDFDLWLNTFHVELGNSPMPSVQAIMPLVVKQDHGLPIKAVIEEVRMRMGPLVEVGPLPLDAFSFKL